MLESNSFPKGQKGFGLTEVIVSMLVLGIAVIEIGRAACRERVSSPV